MYLHRSSHEGDEGQRRRSSLSEGTISTFGRYALTRDSVGRSLPVTCTRTALSSVSASGTTQRRPDPKRWPPSKGSACSKHSHGHDWPQQVLKGKILLIRITRAQQACSAGQNSPHRSPGARALALSKVAEGSPHVLLTFSWCDPDFSHDLQACAVA